MSVANLGAEVAWNRCWSLDFPVYFSPWSPKSDWKLRVLSIQPELRYWLGHNAMQRHFLGLYGQLGYFNVAMGGAERYQDNRPALGSGVSYGYALPFGRHWGAEFNVGAGYARLSYDTFANEPDGEWISSGVRNYWGVTRVGISVCYRFNL